MKSLDRLLAFALGAAVAAVVILAIVIWQSNYPFGFATVRETEELRARIAVLDRALRESELKAQSAAEQWERTADARAAAEAARLKEAQERAKRAEEEAAQAELARARELAAKKARDDAQKAAAARQVAAEKVNAEPSHAETPPRVRNTAATQNDVEALYQQAAAMEGSGHARDAVRTYRRAARAGSGKAAKRLGDLFSCGGLGVVRDQTESSQWYDLAFRLGEPVPTRRDC